MYDSPIKLIDRIVNQFTEQINEATDESIYKAVLEVGVHVDKDELIKALRYDRDQYRKGYDDGFLAGQDKVVRCFECKYYEEVEYYHPTDNTPIKHVCRLYKRQMQHGDFCSYGLRKGGE